MPEYTLKKFTDLPEIYWGLGTGTALLSEGIVSGNPIVFVCSGAILALTAVHEDAMYKLQNKKHGFISKSMNTMAFKPYFLIEMHKDTMGFSP